MSPLWIVPFIIIKCLSLPHVIFLFLEIYFVWGKFGCTHLFVGGKLRDVKQLIAALLSASSVPGAVLNLLSRVSWLVLTALLWGTWYFSQNTLFKTPEFSEISLLRVRAEGKLCTWTKSVCHQSITLYRDSGLKLVKSCILKYFHWFVCFKLLEFLINTFVRLTFTNISSFK